MALHLVVIDPCRTCGKVFNFSAPAGALDCGSTYLPRIARRMLLPGVCDDCWWNFNQWRGRKLGQARRKSHQTHRLVFHSAITPDRMDWSESNAETTYGRFTKKALGEWLIDQFVTEIKSVMREKKKPAAYGKSGRRALSRLSGSASYPKMPGHIEAELAE